ncbi:MAG TPA: serine hydrolase [Dongiaceae bacterium]|nr:serine hydrolase [Dongiaceae bacterium]
MSEQVLMGGFPSAPEQQVTLANWRLPPFNNWAFHHVREIVPSANIYRGTGPVLSLPASGIALPNVVFRGPRGQDWNLDDMLRASDTDGLLVLKSGKVVVERYFNGLTPEAPHIIFSVSKSVTGSLAGILVQQGKLDPEAPVTRYIPETKGSAYGEASLRHVLDMTVSIDFVEDYLNNDGAFARYRDATGWNPIRDPERLSDLRSFLLTLPRAERPHGEIFYYVSPNSDLLGWVLERASGRPYAALLSELLWQRMGAEFDAYVTVDRLGASRAAGGICCTLRDLGRLGELMRHEGRFGQSQVIPADWAADIRTAGDREAWQRGSMAKFLPQGRYRSKWYQTGNAGGAFLGVGIHGQWVYIDPASEVVIAKMSSQKLPVDEALDGLTLRCFSAIVEALR